MAHNRMFTGSKLHVLPPRMATLQQLRKRELVCHLQSHYGPLQPWVAQSLDTTILFERHFKTASAGHDSTLTNSETQITTIFLVGKLANTHT